MMKPLDEDKALWDLLGQAGQPAVSPYFSRRVMAAVRSQSTKRSHLQDLLLRLGLTGALAALVAGFSLALMPSPRARGVPDDLAEIFDSAAGIDTLVASADYSVSTYTKGL